MTIEERAQAMIEAGQWSSSESRLHHAHEWIVAHERQLGGIREHQWQALQRAGERATTLREFYRFVKTFLKGARDRDKAQTGWGQTGLVPNLVESMLRGSRPDPGPAESDLRQALRKLSASKQVAVRRSMRLRACRQFLTFVVTIVATGRRQHDSGRSS